MKKLLVLCVIAVFGLALGARAVFAQSGTPSAKATVKAGNLNIAATEGGNPLSSWVDIVSLTMKNSGSQKDLIIGGSLESTLFTRTLVRSKNGTSDTSTATAGIEVRVLVDNVEAQPGPVVYNKRRQELTATFQGILTGCLSVDPDTGAVIIDEDCVLPEELQLLLETMSANHFNFIATNVGTGVHSIKVQSRINLSSSFQQGEAEAKAAIGKGSVTVEEVRLVKDANISF